MATHDWLDGLSSFIGVVEGDSANVVVENVSFDDTVEESMANETELAVNGCRGATNVVPASSGVVGKCWVGVLEIGDGN